MKFARRKKANVSRTFLIYMAKKKCVRETFPTKNKSVTLVFGTLEYVSEAN